jgi:uncharacterized protein (TIGR03086 family)
MDLTTMEGACASTERIIDGVRPAHLSNPTPCPDWDVRALLNHVTGTLHLGASLLSDSMPTVKMAPGELPDADLVGDDPAKAYRLGVEALLAAAAGDALERPHATPIGEMPGAVLGGFTTLDILVHGWDLATATGQDQALPADLAETVLGFAHQTITDDSRQPRIGPAIEVDPAASATARLVGYLGRQP